MKVLSAKMVLMLFSAVAIVGTNSTAWTQSKSVISIPFVSTVAGLPSGSGNTVCTTGITNQSGQNLGDGCLPSQATLQTPFDVQTDANGDIYMSETGTDNDIRVIYNGGPTLAILLTAANTGIPNFSPTLGRIYTLAGGSSAALVSSGGKYYCGNISGGIQASDARGNGCPAALSFIQPRGMAIDKYGNVYFAQANGVPNIRVIYAGGNQVATLIGLENSGITPKVGYVYRLGGTGSVGYSGDGNLATLAKFVSPRYIAIDSSGNIFFSDGTTQTGTAPVIEAAANNIREINGTTGIITTIAGENTCVYTSTAGCPYGGGGDFGPATASMLSSPFTIFEDANNNLYIADYYNARLRVIYQSGTIAGVSNPQVGYIYTYAGGGTLTSNGTLASQVSFGSVSVAGIDHAGNIYVEDGSNKVIWKFDAISGIGNIIGGGGKGLAHGSFCSGSNGPVSTDSYGDGCPGPQATLFENGTIAFDQVGNFYAADNSYGIVREFSYNNQFPATADGTTVTQPLAFESMVAATLNTESFLLEGSTTSEYSDVGTNDTCAPHDTLTIGQICVFNISFNPLHAGQRSGGIQLGLSISTPPSVTETLSGIGLAADIAVDTGSTSILGTGLMPTGVAADLLGNVYVSDKVSNQVLKGTATGSTLTPLITGLSSPSQIAIDGFGNIYVADTGNNRVLETSSAGITVNVLGSGLLAPKGVAVDGLGGIYVADTGNNRVLRIFANGNQQVLPLSGVSAPTELALNSFGDLFILNSGTNSILRLSSAVQSTVILDSGVTPSGVAVDPAGNIYVTDSTGLRLLAYSPGATTGDFLLSGLTSPVALATDPDANLFIADTSGTGVTELRRSLGNVTFPLTNVGQTTNADITVANVGNIALTFPSAPMTITTGSTYFTVSPANSNGCTVGTIYAAGTECNFTASFTPLAVGSSTATLTFNTNATNTSTISALLSATSQLLVNTTTTLSITSPVPTIYYGQAVNLLTTLSPATTTATPTGTFTLIIDGKTQNQQAIGNGTATFSLANLAVGTHIASVTYSGDNVYASSAATVNFTVSQASTTSTLAITPVSSGGTFSLSFAATIASTTATCNTGTVSFYAGTTLLGTSTPDINGIATYSTPTLTFSPNSFTAVYSGNANCATSTSPPISPIGDFLIGYSTASTSVSQGGVSALSFTVVSLYNGSGTVAPSCTGMPVNSLCRFQPVTMGLGSTSQTETVEFYTNIQSTLASVSKPSLAHGIALALGLPLGLILIPWRRRTRLGLMLVLLTGIMLSSCLFGCSTGTGAATASSGLITPAGTYNVTLVFTGSNGLTTTHSVPITFKVILDSGAF
ncbi:MAG: Ig-like domain repeat protein [Acidobacteriaceae bacterium]|nr:Ig-like domain repeat protein [Acidobacteriaceae bacterium]